MNYAVHWFRRDLRLEDNHALYEAIESGLKVKCIFILDTNILSQLTENDKRVPFIYNRLEEIQNELKSIGSDLWVYVGKPLEILQKLTEDENLKMVFTNRDYEPYAQKRDKAVYELLEDNDISFKGFKDQVIFDKDEILTQNGTPYTVYSPYMRKWKATLELDQVNYLQEFKIELNKENFLTSNQPTFPTLEFIGFKETELPDLPLNLKNAEIKDYDEVRDIPSLDATTKIGTALRFGTFSIREAVKYAIKENETFLNELIWREFFMQILYHFPKVQNHAFRDKYEGIAWRNNEEDFKLWCEGKTGYPLVDAGMRELNATGFMHNRVRMITASFLVKDLLIDWRWGEAYFGQKLMDFDLSSNNGNWQWAAGTGTDAAPYFRIFNPASQQKKFDPDFKYIQKWVPEFGTEDYPNEIVDHKEARERCLTAYKKAISKFEI
ncbi:deoxyribodipyrimidine photo-lyase [Flavobacteriaceae bacterium Ap0902]|nr:deoxyribodipyrimidine photo-lyase [Flavobacteriaceae bacterium Ap0902]